jgi:copper chaperone
MQERFTVRNVKCGGCAATIRSGLQGVPGVTQVEVDVPSGAVVVEGGALARDELARKLAELGYPEQSA